MQIKYVKTLCVYVNYCNIVADDGRKENYYRLSHYIMLFAAWLHALRKVQLWQKHR